jgi:hypothetical protein
MQQNRGGNAERDGEKELMVDVVQPKRLIGVHAGMDFLGNEALVTKAETVRNAPLEGL